MSTAVSAVALGPLGIPPHACMSVAAPVDVGGASAALSAMLSEPPPPLLAQSSMPGYLATHITRQQLADNGMRLAFPPAVMGPRIEQPMTAGSVLATAATIQATNASLGSLVQGLVPRLPLPPPLAGISTSLAEAIVSASYVPPPTAIRLPPPLQYARSRPPFGVDGVALATLAQPRPPAPRPVASFPLDQRLYTSQPHFTGGAGQYFGYGP